MNIQEHVEGDDVLVGQLAVAYAFLSLAPYDNWSHEGTPAEMAAYVVQKARETGQLGMLRDAVLGDAIHGHVRYEVVKARL